MVNSYRKGAEYEREIARALRAHGLKARRGQQYSGANGDPDVVCEDLAEFHLELKRRGDRFSGAELYEAMAQAIRDGRPGTMPVVLHRMDNEQTLATMRLDDWIKVVTRENDKGV